MTKTEVWELIELNKTTFPNFYKDFSESALENMLEVWFEFFKNYETKIIQFYFARALSASKFPVVPADIFNQLNALKNSQEMIPEDLWLIFIKAAYKFAEISEDMFHNPASDFERLKNQANELYNGLPEEIKSFCQDIGEFASYGKQADLEIYVKPVFLKRIAEISKKQKIIKETPPEILNLLNTTLKQIEG